MKWTKIKKWNQFKSEKNKFTGPSWFSNLKAPPEVARKTLLSIIVVECKPVP